MSPTTIFGRKGPRKVTPESAWRKVCVDWLKVRFVGRIWHIRTVGGIGQRSGIPDDFFVIRDGKDGPGIFVAIEFKAPNGRYKLTEKQAAEIESIRRAGGRAGEVKTWEDLEKLVEGIPVVQQSVFVGKK